MGAITQQSNGTSSRNCSCDLFLLSHIFKPHCARVALHSGLNSKYIYLLYSYKPCEPNFVRKHLCPTTHPPPPTPPSMLCCVMSTCFGCPEVVCDYGAQYRFLQFICSSHHTQLRHPLRHSNCGQTIHLKLPIHCSTVSLRPSEPPPGNKRLCRPIPPTPPDAANNDNDGSFEMH